MTKKVLASYHGTREETGPLARKATDQPLDLSPITEFDFGDGRGPVPAHRHPNGGGIVDDLATVDPKAYVGPEAYVYGPAIVGPGDRVEGVVRGVRVEDAEEIVGKTLVITSD